MGVRFCQKLGSDQHEMGQIWDSVYQRCQIGHMFDQIAATKKTGWLFDMFFVQFSERAKVYILFIFILKSPIVEV